MTFSRSTRVLTTAAAFVFALGLGTQHANAAVVFDVNTSIQPAAPADNGLNPWLRATFEQTAANTVQLTMENFLSSGEFLLDCGFNVSDTILTSGLTASYVSGQATVSPVGIGQNAFDLTNSTKAGLFDIKFSYENSNNSNRFVGGETSVYTFTATGLTENDFLAFSADKLKGNGDVQDPGGWYTAARLQGLPPENEGSGSIGTKERIPPDAIPEPAFYQMSGLLILGGLGALRMRKNRNRK